MGGSFHNSLSMWPSSSAMVSGVAAGNCWLAGGGVWRNLFCNWAAVSGPVASARGAATREMALETALLATSA